MATVAVTTKNEGLKGQYVTVLALVGSTADVSNPIDISKFSRGSIQAAGTFGTTTFTVQVSNDGGAYYNPAGLKHVVDDGNKFAKYVREEPTTDVDGTVKIVVNIFFNTGDTNEDI